MSTTVLTVQADTLQQMKSHYEKQFEEPFPNGAIFRARTNQAVITAYRSGKVVFQGSHSDNEANIWQLSSSELHPSKKQKQTDLQLPKSLLTASHIGSDETGTGDYFGPVTVCAAFVKAEQIELFKELGVQDSKNLTDERIQQITDDILHTDLVYSLLTLDNATYNKRQKEGWTQGKMKALLHHHAHKNVIQKLGGRKDKGIIVDQFVQRSTYRNYLHSENEQLLDETYFLTKAESHSIAVAAASLIARTRFVREIDRLSNELNINLTKGASKKVDETIARVIQSFGKDKLYEVGKVHFANTKKAETYLS